MSIAVALTFLLIVLARITDVTLDTLRTAAIIQGRRGFAAILGFFEALIYVVAIAKVLLNIDRPVYAFGYALGYALGTYFGITLEKRLAFGRQLAALVTRKGALLASGLEAAGYKVAVLSGRAGHEEVAILYVDVDRKLASGLLRDAARLDESCFCVLNDVRSAEYVDPRKRRRRAS